MGYFVSDPMYMNEEEEEQYFVVLAERLKREQKNRCRSWLIFFCSMFVVGWMFIAINNFWNLGMVHPYMECVVFIILPIVMIVIHSSNE